MKTKVICLVMLILISCATPKQITNKKTEIQPPNPLQGTWVLKNILTGDILDAPCGFANEGKVDEMNINFTNQAQTENDLKQLNGQSSVNSFTATYKIISYNKKKQTGKISISPIMSTKMGAIEPFFMECEKRYFNLLQSTQDFSFQNGKLLLSKINPNANHDENYPYANEAYANVLYFEKK